MRLTHSPIVGDAIDRALTPGPPGTGLRRLYLLDLLIGYGLRSELHRGWWGQRAIRLAGPWREDLEGPPLGYRQRDTRYMRMWQVHPALGLDELHDHWNGEQRAKHRKGATAVAWQPLRERLEHETGYRALWTPADVSDAAKIYARKPNEMAYRALTTLFDNPLIWQGREIWRAA